MKDTNEKFTIHLVIGNSKLPITIPRDREKTYRDAEKSINERLALYAQRYINKSDDDYLIMTLLDIAVRLIDEQHRNDTEPYTQSVERLTQELEDVLKGK